MYKNYEPGKQNFKCPNCDYIPGAGQMIEQDACMEKLRCPDCYEDGGCVMVSLYDLIRELERIAAGGKV